MAGRPTLYTEELSNRICSLIATSTSGLRGICRDNDDLPSRDTIYQWLSDNKEFSDRYARAKDMQADLIFEDTIEIADDTSNDTLIGENGEYGNSVAVARARLRIDARKWAAGKLAPKKYGDKVDLNVGGQGSENPLIIHTIPQINIMNPHVPAADDSTPA